MNGSWMLYGVQADAFKATWIRMANIMRSLAPNVALVWSPNFDLGNGATYDPYYPGDDYVDWVGLSAYWKGSKNAATQDVNTQAPSDYFTQIVDGTGTEGGMVNFYTNYASGKGKPFVLSEGGAAFITCEEASGSSNCVATAVGDGQSTIEMSFWNSVLSDSFLSAHPLFKMFQIFEHKKFEEYNGGTGSVFRDYRVSVDGTTRDAFAARVATLASAGKLVLGKAFTASSSSSASVTKSATSASVSTASTSSSSKTTGAAASVRPGFTSSAAAAAFVLASLGAVLFTF
ncbi:hypothetical protein HK405_015662 [Cladochytrium tenue]|nr:hypothetical protein HK405_015662 [Cladochytrium tenue]